jgi:hypothetical protein
LHLGNINFEETFEAAVGEGSTVTEDDGGGSMEAVVEVARLLQVGGKGEHTGAGAGAGAAGAGAAVGGPAAAGVDTRGLIDALCFKRIRNVEDEAAPITVGLRAEEATDTRDAIAKAVYQNLFR